MRNHLPVYDELDLGATKERTCARRRSGVGRNDGSADLGEGHLGATTEQTSARRWISAEDSGEGDTDWTVATETTNCTWETNTRPWTTMEYIDGGAWDSSGNTIGNFMDRTGEDYAAADERWQLVFACATMRTQHRDLATSQVWQVTLANYWRLIFSSFAKF